MAIIPPASFYLGAPTNTDGVSIYRAIHPIAISGSGNIGILSDDGTVISSITSTIPGTVTTSLSIPTTEALIAYVGGGSGISVPLSLTGAVPYQLYLNHSAGGNFYIGHSGTNAELLVVTGNLRLQGANALEVLATTDATSPTTGSIITQGGISAQKKLFSGDSVNVDSNAANQIGLTHTTSTNQAGIGVDSTGDLMLTSDSGQITMDESIKMNNGTHIAYVYLDPSGNLNLDTVTKVVNKKPPYYLTNPIIYEETTTVNYISTGCISKSIALELVRYRNIVYCKNSSFSLAPCTATGIIEGAAAVPVGWRPIEDHYLMTYGKYSGTVQPFRFLINSSGDVNISYRTGLDFTSGVNLELYVSTCFWYLN